MNGVQNYMRYAESKLREEEQRAQKYLESCGGGGSIQNLVDSCVSVLESLKKTSYMHIYLALTKQFVMLKSNKKNLDWSYSKGSIN